MGFRRLAISNFKSFGPRVEVPLGNFNVIVGVNASGKTNFRRTFEFLHDLGADGLDSAVFQQGGREFLANKRLGITEPLAIDVEADVDVRGLRNADDSGTFEQRITEVDYKLKVDLDRSLAQEDLAEGFNVFERTVDSVTREVVERKVGRGSVKADSGGPDRIGVVGGGVIPLYGMVRHSDLEPGKPKDWLLFPRTGVAESSGVPLLNEPALFLREAIWNAAAVFDIDPRALKYASTQRGKPTLETDGENLPIVLRWLTRDAEKARMLARLVKDALPFFTEVDVESLPDTTVLLKIRETYCDSSFPATFLSDGTINVVALVVALYFDERPTVIIEEPERSLHPSLIGRIVEMMQDAAAHKQIIITTQSSEVIKHVGVDPLLLITRDAQGFSAVEKPADKKQVRVFLENEVGLDALYVQNLLHI